MSNFMSAIPLIEILATGANLLYIVLLIREKVACWSFGIIGSLLSIYLFIDARLYSEAFLYLFYAAMGVWGWVAWQDRLRHGGNPVIRWRTHRHLLAIFAACLLATALGASVALRLVDTRDFRWVHHALYIATFALSAAAFSSAWWGRPRDAAGAAAATLAPAFVPLAVIPYAGTHTRRHPLIALTAAPFIAAAAIRSRR